MTASRVVAVPLSPHDFERTSAELTVPGLRNAGRIIRMGAPGLHLVDDAEYGSRLNIGWAAGFCCAVVAVHVSIFLSGVKGFSVVRVQVFVFCAP